MVLFKNVSGLLFVLCVISRLAQAEYEDEVQDDFSQDEVQDDSQNEVKDDVEGRDLVIIKPGDVTDTMTFITEICNCTCENCVPPPIGPPEPPPIIITPPPIVITRPPKTKSTKRPTTPPSRRTTPKTPRTPPPPPPPPPPSRRTTPKTPRTRTPSTKTPKTPRPPPTRPPPTRPPPSRRTTPKTPRTPSIPTRPTPPPSRRTRSTTRPPRPSSRTTKPVRTTPRLPPPTRPTPPPATPPPPTKPPTIKLIEIVFLIDVRCGYSHRFSHGLDGDTFRQMINTAKAITRKARFGLIFYGADECYTLQQPLTTNQELLVDSVDELHVDPQKGKQAALGGMFLTITSKEMGWTPGKAPSIPKILVLITELNMPANVTGGSKPPMGDGSDECKEMKVPRVDRIGSLLRQNGMAVFGMMGNKESYGSWRSLIQYGNMGIQTYGGWIELGNAKLIPRFKKMLLEQAKEKI